MQWHKHGLVVAGGAASEPYSRHTQVPVLDTTGDSFLLYYSARNEDGRSLPFAVALQRNKNGFESTGLSRALDIRLGAEGEFDEHGIMPTAVIRRDQQIYLYYIGWSRCGKYPYTNNIGLATSADGILWEKRGRVMHDPGCLYTGTLEIVASDDTYYGYYLACDEWLPSQGEIPAEARYRLRIATSMDGISWIPLDRVAIDYLGAEEGGIGSARVLSCGGRYHMFYCYRGIRTFRTDRGTSYRIGYAHSVDLLHWVRRDELMADFRSQKHWADFMQCFPDIYKDSDAGLLWMFYNGNGFGQTGIGLASLPLEELPG